MQDISARITWVWAALGLLTACGSSTPTTGLAQYVTGVQSSNGSLTAALHTGAPPTGPGPSVTVDASGAAIAGGAQFIQIICSTDCTRIIVAVQGVDGYYDLSGLSAALLQSIIMTIGEAPPPTFELEVGGGTTASVGALQGVPLTLTTVGLGDVQVSLNWDVDSDLDLHVVEPDGEEIYYDNLTSGTGGMLDLDSNAACSLDHKRAEHVTWPTGKAPHGTYTVIADSWSLCAFTLANYVVTVNVTAKPPQLFFGNFATADEGGACYPSSGTTLLCGRLITTLTFP
jgi:hypothetical protein